MNSLDFAYLKFLYILIAFLVCSFILYKIFKYSLFIDKFVISKIGQDEFYKIKNIGTSKKYQALIQHMSFNELKTYEKLETMSILKILFISKYEKLLK